MGADWDFCFMCTKPAVHRHHLSGRAPGRLRLDDELVVPLCRSHHVYAHELLRSQRIDTPPRGTWTPVHSVAFRLARLATFCGLCAIYHDEPLWALLAVALRAWADELNNHNDNEQDPQ